MESREELEKRIEKYRNEVAGYKAILEDKDADALDLFNVKINLPRYEQTLSTMEQRLANDY